VTGFYPRNCCFLLLLAASVAIGLAMQENKVAQIKVQSRLVLVDLIITDDDGNFVADLRADEVRIFEDNKERAVSSFDLRQAALPRFAGGAQDRPAPPAGIAAEVAATTQFSEPGVTLVFLLDLGSIVPSHLPQVKETITDFVRSKINPNDRLMLAVAGQGVRVHQPPTRDVAKFLQALDKVAVMAEASSRLLRFGEELDILVIQMKAADLSPQFVSRNATSLGRQYIMEEEELVRSAHNQIIEFIREIGTLPGRKNVLFYSGGYRLKIALVIQDMLLRQFGGMALPGGETSSVQIKSTLGAMESAMKLESYLLKIIEEANRASVSFYSVDIRALMPREDVRFRRIGSQTNDLWREETNQPQSFLRDVAAGTGGRWFLNSNDLATGIERVYQDSAQYYELGYVPDGPARPGKLHRITLKVSRPNVQVSHRQSYVEPEEFDAERRALENAFKFPELFQDFPIEADTTEQDRKLKIEVFVPTRYLSFSRSGERYRCELSVHMALFDGAGNMHGGKTLFSKTYRLDYSEAERSQVEKYNNVTSTYQGNVEPGEYRLRVVVRQTPAAKTATLERHLTVP